MKPVFALSVLCVLLFGLSGCQSLPRGVDIIDRPIGRAADSSAYLEGIEENQYWVLRSSEELEQLKLELGLPELFEGEAIDFGKEMIVGSIGKPMQKNRTYEIFRVLYSPETVDVEVVSYLRKELEETRTPYTFVRVPRSEKPVRFYLNFVPAMVEHLEPLEPGIHQETITRRMHYAVFVPPGLDEPAPLLVFLHSSGSNGKRWVIGLKERAERYGFVLIVPSARNGYYWTEAYDFPAILEAIDEVKLRYPVDPERVYAGSSAGGHTVYHFAIENHEVFAAFFSAFGRLNPEVEDAILEKGKGMPALIICGEDDPVVPIEKVQAGRERLEKFGVEVTFRADPVGHGGTEEMTEYIFQWLSQQAYGTDKPRAER